MLYKGWATRRWPRMPDSTHEKYGRSVPEAAGEANEISARNVLSATVKSVTPGAVDTEVIVEVAPGIEIVSIITKKSAEALGLKVGSKTYAIIKASNVMIGID